MKAVLTNPTDDELNAAVAEHVARLPVRYDARLSAPRGAKVICHSEEYGVCSEMPPYATSADAVLPLLENEKKRGMWVQIKDHTNGIDCGRRDWLVIISDYDDCCDPYEGEPGYPKPGPRLYCEGVSPTFPRAACLALLRANGVEVVT